MAINVTTWRPDTCGCEALYSWDTEVPAEARVHQLADIRPCPAHERLHATHEARFAAMQHENQAKNLAFTYAVAEIPEMSFVTTNPETGEEETKHRHADFEWAFDENRHLHYTVKRGTPQQLARVEQKLAASKPEVASRLVGLAALRTLRDAMALKADG